jgi:hypothetical protein
MELRDALTQIEEIRLRLAEAELFRGYRAGPAAVSGLLAATAAAVQGVVLPEPAGWVPAYLAFWFGVALLSVLAAGLGMLARGPTPTRAATWAAVGQLLPALLAGVLVTAALVPQGPDAAALLPGLWQVLFGLGLFASARFLPRPVAVVAAFYLICGAAVLALARGPHAFSPWAMGLPFGLGQLAAAAVLYWHLERRHAAD